MAMTPLLFPGDAPDLAGMDGKAFALAQLTQKFPVPAWFVVTPAAEIDGLALDDALSRLGPGPYAVRSSALDEDGGDHSFAGQLSSFLNVARDEVPEKFRQVRDSAFTAGVQAYRKERGMAEATARPAVLIQKMVQADAAGVAFTADPVSQDRDIIAIMAVAGLADRLVSGEENGDTYHLSRDGAIQSQILTGAAPILSDSQKQEVARLALAVEKHFGRPQDIEWAFAQGTLHLLQARPITTLRPAGDIIIWDNSNIVESYSGVTAPLTFSFARYAYCEVYKSFSRLMGVSRREVERHHHVFANMLGTIQGHVYYNLLNWYRALALFPGFTMNRAFMEQMMGVGEALPDDLVRKIAPPNTDRRARLAAALRTVWTALAIICNAIVLPRRVSHFYQHLNHVLADPAPLLSARTLPELATYYRMLERELLANWQTPIVNDFLCMIAFGASRKILDKWCGAEGQPIHNDFMIGQGDIISAEPAQRIRRMATLARGDENLVNGLIQGNEKILAGHPGLQSQFAGYLQKFGDRCTQELKLESLTLHEDSASLLQAIGYTARKEHRPDHVATDPESRLNMLLKNRPVKRWTARFMLRWAKARIRDRENLRFERTRVFGRVRRVFLEMGRLLARENIITSERDIFYLQVDEILGLIEGTITTTDLKALIALRQADAQKFNAQDPPPNRFQTTGAVLPFLTAGTLTETAMTATGEDRRGLGCCSGIVTGKVRVIQDPRREALQPGEILVARHTDPGWIALFSNAAGIIVERGSLLSHSAIVAREMGIPAIVGIADIMQWLKTGDVVEMNGATGAVVKAAHD